MSALVIEDEYLIAVEAQRILEDAGATGVVLANSVAKVRELLGRGARFHVGILDLKLGEEDASPLIDDLRSYDIPFLVATGFNDAGDLQHGTVMIRKPYCDAEVVGAIQSLIACRH